MSHRRSSTSDAVLVSARIEFIEQLNDAIAPYIIHVVESLWQDSKRRVRAFQELLQGIPRWNSVVFESHSRTIESRYPDVGDLIASVLIATVKMMASIKIGDGDEQIRIKIPTNDAFIAKVFVKTARIFYESPDLIRESSFQKRTVVQLALERAIRDMLPVADLLASYTSGFKIGGNEAPKEVEPEVCEEVQEEIEEKKDDITPQNNDDFEYENEEGVQEGDFETVGETKRVELSGSSHNAHVETSHDSFESGTGAFREPATQSLFVPPAPQVQTSHASSIPPPPPPPPQFQTQQQPQALRGDAADIDW